jgi:hypothetical protein
MRRIIKIEEIDYDDFVYDFSIDKFEKFYANNILCHNTDSIITRKEVIDSKILGKLKLEKIIKNGLIIKPKLYFLNDEIKSKGVPIPRDVDKGKEFIKREKLKDNLLKGKMINYSKFIKIKEGITRDIKVNSIILASKKLSLEDNKRNWKGKFFNPDELQESIPLEIKENEE